MDTFPSTFQGALLWLAGAGGPALIAAILTLVAENWAAWHTFPKWVKFGSPLVLSVLLAFVANWLLGYTSVITAVDPYYQIALAAGVAWLTSQKTYTDYKLKGYAEKQNPPPEG